LPCLVLSGNLTVPDLRIPNPTLEARGRACLDFWIACGGKPQDKYVAGVSAGSVLVGEDRSLYSKIPRPWPWNPHSSFIDHR
jgi:hypothetical protein